MYIPEDVIHNLVTGHGMLLAVATVANDPANGPTLAWVHGLGAASSLAFVDVARHRALLGTTSLLIDLPGHGQSTRSADWAYTIEDQAAALSSVLDQLTDAPVILIGHSMGGSIAIALTTMRPDLVAHLVVAEPNLDPGIGTTSVSIARQSETTFVEHGYPAMVQATARLARRGNADATAWLPSLLLADPVALHRSATSLLAPRVPTFRDMLLDVPVPVATIWGDRSRLPEPPLVYGDNLQGYVISGAGHQIHDDNPDEFARLLARIAGR